MNRLVCQTCKSENVAFMGGPVRDGAGRTVYPKKCGDCGFRWSDTVRPIADEPPAAAETAEILEAPEVPEAPEPLDTGGMAPEPSDIGEDIGGAEPTDAELAAADDADDAGEPLEPTDDEDLGEPAAEFNAETVVEGDKIRYTRGGEEMSGEVISVTTRTVLVEVEGDNDHRVDKDMILGLAD